MKIIANGLHAYCEMTEKIKKNKITEYNRS